MLVSHPSIRPGCCPIAHAPLPPHEVVRLLGTGGSRQARCLEQGLAGFFLCVCVLALCVIVVGRGWE